METMTNAYFRFKILIDRTKDLIELGSIGVNKKSKEIVEILDKFKNVKGKSGRFPKDNKPYIKIEKSDVDSDKFNIECDDLSGFLMKEALVYSHSKTEELNNHLYSIYLVYVWGAFETYLVMMFEELFRKKSEMLKSKESITYCEILENKRDIVSYLIDNELNKIGHFSLENYYKYLETKVNFKFTKNEKDKLNIIYLLRNIIVHNTGIVPNRHKSNIPKSLKVKDSELLISLKYLELEIQSIKTVIKRIEQHIQTKFK